MKYWLWLTTRKGLGAKSALAVLRFFGSPEAAFYADADQYRRIEGLRSPSCLEDKDLSEPERIMSECYRQNIHILTYQDAAYPARLKNIDDPPLVLYYQGTLPAFDEEPVIAMVGTRHGSGYGLMQAKNLGLHLAKMGALIISGGAEGGDSMALRGALASGRPVAAVLGCGVDVVYPACNRELFADIRSHGCILSEYAPGTPALGAHFPVRNRLLSGLALGVVVVEAPRKSGALITAAHALEQGKDVFTIPANVGTHSCEGNIQLLKDGAIVVEDGWDVMKEYVHLFPNLVRYRPKPFPMGLSLSEAKMAAEPKPVKEEPRQTVAETAKIPESSDKRAVDRKENGAYIDLREILENLSPDEKTVAQLLETAPQHIDDLIEQSQLPAGRVLAALTLLEIKGYVKRLPARRFSLAER